MSLPLEFDVDAIGRESKAVYSFSVDLPEGLGDLARQSFLSSSGFCPEDRIAPRWDCSSGRTPVDAGFDARGRRDGPTLVVTAGVHGDEYEGMEAIYRVFEALDPEQMRGTFVALPIITLPAFWLGIRCNPVDSKNMARVFPGAANGSYSERLAWAVLQRVLRHASFYIDLHSLGAELSYADALRLLHAGEAGRRRPEAALAFGAPVVWAHPETSVGRTLSATLDLDIPSLTRKPTAAGTFDRKTWTATQGPGQPVENSWTWRSWTGPGCPRLSTPGCWGDPATWMSLSSAGRGDCFCVSEIGAGVRSGEVLGIVRSLDGEIAEEITAPEDGVLILMRATPASTRGRTLRPWPRNCRSRGILFFQG